MYLKYLLTVVFVVVKSALISAQQDSVIYSFFSAGHTYGSPFNYQYGLHQPFVDYIPKLNQDSKLSFGFLTGDVVYKSNQSYWDSAQIDIDKIKVPVHITPGNHDYNNYYKSRFGDTTYKSFKHNSDLFICLTPSKSNWNVEGGQLDFLEATLDSHYLAVNNIFIFLHELIWWSPTNQYSTVRINFEPDYPGVTNYKNDIEPLLESYPNAFTIIAGDVGARIDATPFMYSKSNNITLIASGMGGGIEDNLIITEVYADSVNHKLISLNNTDSTYLGSLLDYKFPLDSDSLKVEVYPNPATDFINLKNSNREKIKYSILDSRGSKVMSGMLGVVKNFQINIGFLSSGIYFFNVSNEKESVQLKFIVL